MNCEAGETFLQKEMQGVSCLAKKTKLMSFQTIQAG
jgi:hypothetical protein